MTTLNSNNLTTQNKKGSRRWIYGLFIFAALVLIISSVFRLLTPITPEEKTDQINTWQGITPGTTTVGELEKKLGQPIDQIQNADGTTTLHYQSAFTSIPNQVVADDQNTIQFIKEYYDYTQGFYLADYIQEHGEADFSLTDLGTSDAVLAHIFLTDGVVLVANKSNNYVIQKWYFTPTTKENFLAQWGKNLSESATIREELDLMPQQ